MTSLHDPVIRTVLNTLSTRAREIDSRVVPLIREERRLVGDATPSPRLKQLVGEAFLAVSPEVGRYLYQLVRMRAPRSVVEFGTSHGISTIHIAAALRDNGFGRVITTELDEHKAKCARANLAGSGLDAWVELRIGDAFETLAAGAEEPIEFLLLDGWKAAYLRLLRHLEPYLAPRCVVVADDTLLFADELTSYMDYVRAPPNGYASVAVPLDDGIEVSIRD